MTMRRTKQNGTTIIEFVLVTALVLGPLLLGAMVVGFNIIRVIHVNQVNRDAGHMFARGVNFSTSNTGLGNRAVLTMLSPRLGNSSSSGTGMLVLSAIQYVGPNTCSNCANLNHAVFVRQLIIGNSSLSSSHFGTVPISSMATDAQGTVDGTGTVKSPYSDLAVRADAILAAIPPVDGIIMNDGDTAYVSETYFTSTDFDIKGFLTSSSLYARAIF